MSAVKNQESGPQGGTVTLDVYFYDYEGGPLADPDDQTASYEIKDPSGVQVETGQGTRTSFGSFEVVHNIAAAATVSDQWSITWTAIILGQTVTAEENFRVVAVGTAQFSTEHRIGFAFGNPDLTSSHHAPGFGLILTPDEMRYQTLFGTKLVSPDASQTYDDNMLQLFIDASIAEVASMLRIDILPHVNTHRPQRDINGQRSARTDLPQAYTDFINLLTAQQADLHREERGYPYRKAPAKNAFLLFKTRHRPVRSIDKVHMVDPVQHSMVDLMPYLLEELGMAGRLQFTFTNTAQIPIFIGAMSPFSYPFDDFPDAFLIDYSSGYNNAADVPDDLREVIRIVAGVKLLNDFGDGKSPGLAGASVNLNSISESFTTTQSATNALYGARIGQWLKWIDQWFKRNKYKYGVQFMGCL